MDSTFSSDYTRRKHMMSDASYSRGPVNGHRRAGSSPRPRHYRSAQALPALGFTGGPTSGATSMTWTAAYFGKGAPATGSTLIGAPAEGTCMAPVPSARGGWPIKAFDIARGMVISFTTRNMAGSGGAATYCGMSWTQVPAVISSSRLVWTRRGGNASSIISGVLIPSGGRWNARGRKRR